MTLELILIWAEIRSFKFSVRIWLLIDEKEDFQSYQRYHRMISSLSKISSYHRMIVSYVCLGNFILILPTRKWGYGFDLFERILPLKIKPLIVPILFLSHKADRFWLTYSAFSPYWLVCVSSSEMTTSISSLLLLTATSTSSFVISSTFLFLYRLGR